MKKTILAVAIPAVLFAGSASAVEILKSEEGSVDFYGHLRTELKAGVDTVDADDKKIDGTTTLGAGSSRAGLSASYAIGEGINAIGLFEFGISGNGGALENRLHYAGFDGDFGMLTFGRQWTHQDDYGSADQSYFFGGTALRYTAESGGLHDNLVKYKFNGESFGVGASYGLDEDESAAELYEIFVDGNIAGLGLIAGYAGEKDNVGVTETLETAAWTLQADYSIGDLYLKGSYYNNEYTQQNDKITEDALGLGGVYSFGKTALYGGYEYVSFDGTVGGVDISSSDIKDNSSVFYLGVEHKFNSWARVYAEYAYLDGTTLGVTNNETGVDIGPTRFDKASTVAAGMRVYW
ncbi:porin [Agarivorans sp. Alg241-V36]|uniref:porin n=1 Tax=Agarivorans sp. Alg241-V36 TaxID=2305992 RepID=UPI0013D8B8DF|nr:porin [Agarivorans sp. Alg241-V36]